MNDQYEKQYAFQALQREAEARRNNLRAEADAKWKAEGWPERLAKAQSEAAQERKDREQQVYEKALETYAAIIGKRVSLGSKLGIVEVAGPHTTWPANRGSWSLPQIGQLFLRLLKQDGTPGIRVEKITGEITVTDGGFLAKNRWGRAEEWRVVNEG